MFLVASFDLPTVDKTLIKFSGTSQSRLRSARGVNNKRFGLFLIRQTHIRPSCPVKQSNT